MMFTSLKEMPLREIYCAMLEQNAFLKELREYAEHEGYVIPWDIERAQGFNLKIVVSIIIVDVHLVEGDTFIWNILAWLLLA